MARPAATKAKAWYKALWVAGGIGVTGGVVWTTKTQFDDPDSVLNHASSRIKHGLQEAAARSGVAMRQLMQQLRSRLLPAPRAPPERLPLPGSIPGHTARWLADWCEDAPERAEVVVSLGGAPLMAWLLDLTCSPSSSSSSSSLAGATQGIGGDSYKAHSSSVPRQSVWEDTWDEREGAEGEHGLQQVDGEEEEEAGGGGMRDDATVAEAKHAERALASLLLSDTAMGLLVSRPGALPRLLRHATSESASSHLRAALCTRALIGFTSSEAPVPPSTTSADSTAPAVGAVTSGWQYGDGSTHVEAYLSDLQELVAMFMGPPRGDHPVRPALHTSPTPLATRNTSRVVAHAQEAQQLAAAFLAAWAEQGGPNTAKLLGAGLTSALSAVADDVTAAWPTPSPPPLAPPPGTMNQPLGAGKACGLWPGDLPWQLVRIVSALASGHVDDLGSVIDPVDLGGWEHVRGGVDADLGGSSSGHTSSSSSRVRDGSSDRARTATPSHHLAACVPPLLYVAAGAAAERDEELVGATLRTLRAALAAGAEPVQDALGRTNALPLMRSLVAGCSARLACEVAHTVASLAHAGVLGSEPSDVAYWRTWALNRLLADGAGSSAPTAPAAGIGGGLAAAALGGGDGVKVGLLPPSGAATSRSVSDEEAQMMVAHSRLEAAIAAETVICIPTRLSWPRTTGHPSGVHAESSTTDRVGGPGVSAGSTGSSSSSWSWSALPKWWAARTSAQALAPPVQPFSSLTAVPGAGGAGRAGSWVAAGPEGEELEASVREACVGALSALAAVPGTPGLQVGHHWLAALLSALGRRVWPYNAVVYTGPQLEAGGNVLLLPSTGSSSSGSATGSTDKGGAGAGDKAGVSALDLLDAVPVLPSHIQSVAAALEAASDAVDVSDVLEPPPHFDLGGVGVSLGSSTAIPAGKRKPKGSGTGGSTTTGTTATAVSSTAGAASGSGVGGAGQVGAGGGAGGAGARGGTGQELSDGDSTAHQGDLLAAQPRVCDALEVLSALVAADPQKQAWLLTVGILPLLAHLTSTTTINPTPTTTRHIVPLPTPSSPLPPPSSALQLSGSSARASGGVQPEQGGSSVADSGSSQQLARLTTLQQDPGAGADALVAAATDPYSDHDGPAALCVKRQVARLLALLALHTRGRDPVRGVAGRGWVAWLRAAARSDDCRLASHATKALLNLEALSRRRGGRTAGSSQPGELAAPLFLDMVHILDAGAPHHWTLARQGTWPPAADQLLSPVAGVTVMPLAPGVVSTGAQVQAGVGFLVEGTTQQAVAVHHVANDPSSSSDSSVDDASTTLIYPLQLTGQRSAPLNTSGSGVAAISSGSSVQYLQDEPAPDETNAIGLAMSFTTLFNRLPHRFATASANSLPAPAASSTSHTGSSLQALAGVVAGNDCDTCGGMLSQQMPLSQQGLGSSSHMAAAASSTQQGLQQPLAFSLSGGGGTLSQSGGGQSDSRGQTEAWPQTDPRALPPEVDIVFVHGIRGGPFITWRKPGVQAVQGPAVASRRWLSRDHVWPAAWLPLDFPTARLLSLEYLAPISGWEGESLPLEATVVRAMDALVAAGVGQRPVVFVAHSMGGLLVKEMLAHSLKEQQQQQQLPATPGLLAPRPSPSGARSSDALATGRAALAAATRGAVFFATPHFGSQLAAVGWRLRHVPYASPAPVLAKLTPGPHLEELNAVMKRLYDAGALRVTAAGEGKPTALSPVLPKILIVPPTSAYPGFGVALPLDDQDHISLCKPSGRDAPAYRAVADMVGAVLRDAAREGSPGSSSSGTSA